MRASAAVVLLALACSACGSDPNADAKRVEAQVAQRFGPKATAECTSSSDGRSWLCDVFFEDEPRHEGCSADVDDNLRIVRFEAC
jgi:hypothetical protein